MRKKTQNYSYSSILRFFLIIFIFVSLAFLKSNHAVVQAAIPSEKKGVAGAVLSQDIDPLNISWFYDWTTPPRYATQNAWTDQVWEKFIPMFYYWTASASPSYNLENHLAVVASKMRDICNNTDYCTNPSKGYYLMSNEPDSGVYAKTTVSYVYELGRTMQTVRNYDPDAKFIVWGLATLRPEWPSDFVWHWNRTWGNDSQLSNFMDNIAGVHVHTYGNCNISNVTSFRNSLNTLMQTHYGQNMDGKEIWITEIGSLNKTMAISEVKNTMNSCVNNYESSSLIDRYAWFYYGCDTTNFTGCSQDWGTIVLWRNNNLTEVGQHYSTLALQDDPNPTATPLPTALPTTVPTAVPTATSTPVSTNTPVPTATAAPNPTSTPIQPTATPAVTGQINCVALRIFNENYIQLNVPAQTQTLAAGDKVYIGLSYTNTTPPQTNLTAKFSINQGSWITTNERKIINDVEYFVQEFIIPDEVYDFSVRGIVE